LSADGFIEVRKHPTKCNACVIGGGVLWIIDRHRRHISIKVSQSVGDRRKKHERCLRTTQAYEVVSGLDGDRTITVPRSGISLDGFRIIKFVFALIGHIEGAKGDIRKSCRHDGCVGAVAFERKKVK